VTGRCDTCGSYHTPLPRVTAAAPTPDPGALLDRLEEARKAATPGPWEQDIYEIQAHRRRLVAETGWRPDAALIVAAVNALPDLLRLARDGLALRAGVERLAAEFDSATSPPVISDFDRGLVAGYARAADQIRAVVADTSGEA